MAFLARSDPRLGYREAAVIYCDNAATSFPKPPSVARAMADHLENEAVNPGRSSFDLAIQAAARIDALRVELGRLFGNPADDPNRTIFTSGATAALNLTVGGLCAPGDHVVAEATAHNSVLRPLHELRRRDRLDFAIAPCDGSGRVDPQDIARLITPTTRLVVLNHASNVTGTLQDVAAVGRLCREREILLVLDCAQTAGTVDIDMARDLVDVAAFTGHKGLLGPTGTGGLVLGPRAEPEGTVWGGTGVRSEELEQPRALPYRLEAGTLNAVGLVGLAAGVAWLAEQEPGAVAASERELAENFAAGCREIPGVRTTGRTAGDGEEHVAVVSLECGDIPAEKVGVLLDVQWEIAARTGLHCAPLIHTALGTSPGGTVRFSFGPFNTKDQLPRLHQAITAIVRGS
ncbi:cysteine desulfurase [bacterium CG_4_9_14_3_um_filter_65_15]|nr:MAG: cysteine desulfurase [bacterium CG_4_9_14_3_um_filter_65_15]